MSECSILARQRLAKLQAAVANTELRVKFSDGREVQYKSTEEILQAIRATEKIIQKDENSQTRIRRAFPFFINRGL